MLHDDQRTVAPRVVSVSIRTAVWMVICKQPAIRAPFKGLLSPNSWRIAMRPGISSSAMLISLRPHSASEKSLTLKSWVVVVPLMRVAPVPVCLVATSYKDISMSASLFAPAGFGGRPCLPSVMAELRPMRTGSRGGSEGLPHDRHHWIVRRLPRVRPHMRQNSVASGVSFPFVVMVRLDRTISPNKPVRASLGKPMVRSSRTMARY